MSKRDSTFIVGFPRSGTTLLLHMLMSSGEFPTYTFTETHFFSHYYRRFGRLDRPRNRARFQDEFCRSPWFLRSGISREALLDEAAGDPSKYSTYLAAFMDLLAQSQSKTRWLEKTPWHMLYIPEIRRGFPNARIVVVVRDPRDVVLSAAGYGWTDRGIGGPLRAAIAWRWHMERLERDLGREATDAVVVRYEDMVSDTAHVLERINAFLELCITEESLAQSPMGTVRASNSSFGRSATGITTQSAGRWRDEMDPRLMRQVERVTRPLLDRYGYESTSVGSLSPAQGIKTPMLNQGYALAKSLRSLAFPILRR